MFGQNALIYVMTSARRGRRSFVLHKVRQSYISRTVWPCITNFYTNHAGEDVTSYFCLEVIQVRKTAENDASDDFNIESLKLAYTSISTSGTAVLDTTSLPPCGRLQNAVKYCTKESINSACFAKISDGYPCRLILQPHRIWRHRLLPVDIFRSSNRNVLFLCVQF